MFSSLSTFSYTAMTNYRILLHNSSFIKNTCSWLRNSFCAIVWRWLLIGFKIGALTDTWNLCVRLSLRLLIDWINCFHMLDVVVSLISLLWKLRTLTISSDRLRWLRFLLAYWIVIGAFPRFFLLFLFIFHEAFFIIIIVFKHRWRRGDRSLILLWWLQRNFWFFIIFLSKTSEGFQWLSRRSLLLRLLFRFLFLSCRLFKVFKFFF